MSPFANWFRKSSRTDHRSRRRRPALHPVVGQLEHRQLLSLSVSYHGGPLIPNVQVETLYLGQAWADPQQLQATARSLNSFFGSITNSPYMDSLGQYNVHRGQFLG